MFSSVKQKYIKIERKAAKQEITGYIRKELPPARQKTSTDGPNVEKKPRLDRITASGF